MSRTEAHTPWWVRAPWYVPYHGLWCGRRYVCDLPERPVRHAGPRSHVLTHRCNWHPIWPVYRLRRTIFGNSMPRWYVEHVWHNVERTRERGTLGEMVKEYNANGELDDGDFPCWGTGRHGAWWGWD